MSTLETLKARAAEAWEKDDGQATVEQIADAAVRRAVRDGIVLPSLADTARAAAVAHINARLSAPIPAAPVDPLADEVARLTVEWESAVKAGSVWMTVHDEDGGTSRVFRTPSGWSHEGCATLAQYLRAKSAAYASKQDAACCAAAEEFRAWWASAQGLPLPAQKAGWSKLSKAAKLCAVGVVPKSLRRELA
jgi:hypothetical protein